MRWSRYAALGLALTLPACSETGIEVVDLVGVWDATKFEFEETTGDPVVTVDLITMNFTVTIEINEAGTYEITTTFLGGEPQVESGTWVLEGGDLLIMTASGETVGDEFDVTLSGTTLTVRTSDLTFDFDDDGTEEPALFEAILEKR
jgi:hypothetical protein